MLSDDEIEYLWLYHLERAMGCSHPALFDYADKQIALLLEQNVIAEEEAKP